MTIPFIIISIIIYILSICIAILTNRLIARYKRKKRYKQRYLLTIKTQPKRTQKSTEFVQMFIDTKQFNDDGDFVMGYVLALHHNNLITNNELKKAGILK